MSRSRRLRNGCASKLLQPRRQPVDLVGLAFDDPLQRADPAPEPDTDPDEQNKQGSEHVVPQPSAAQSYDEPVRVTANGLLAGALRAQQLSKNG